LIEQSLLEFAVVGNGMLVDFEEILASNRATHDPASSTQSGQGGEGRGSGEETDDPDVVAEGDVRPGENDADDPAVAFLGHTNVSVKPVLDVLNQTPVDGYETPASMAEALHLRNPADIFPFGTSLSRRKDRDHTVPYLSPDDGGPPGQTNMGNLGPLVRFHHRVRTHGRWRVRRPEPGVYLWRSPHGWLYLLVPVRPHRLTQRRPAQAIGVGPSRPGRCLGYLASPR
jgi:hypothetical protein